MSGLDFLCITLGVLFVALKLTGVIAWSWVWVTAPFWLPVTIILIFMMILWGLLYTTNFT